MEKNKNLKIKLVISLIVLISTSIAYAQENQVASNLVHNAGFNVTTTRIDGPDFFESNNKNEAYFQRVYRKLQGKYGADYLPDDLPKELLPIRQGVYNYIQKYADGSITGGKFNSPGKKETYYAGENGINNGHHYDYSVKGLPDKITRLSYCFGISPRIITAWIDKESTFIGAAVSNSGAVGFTQLTNVALVEVSEQLGYATPGIPDNTGAQEVYNNYINCFLKSSDWGDQDFSEWDLPWVLTDKDGKPIIDPDHKIAIKKTRAGRNFKHEFAIRADKWLTGRDIDTFPTSSHDNGLIYGALLLKFYLGHPGKEYKAGLSSADMALRNYNGDTGRAKYSRVIRERARRFEIATPELTSPANYDFKTEPRSNSTEI